MNILMLVSKRQYRGAEVSAATLSEHLIKLGHNVIWVGINSVDSNPLFINNATNLDLGGKDSKYFSLYKCLQLVTLLKKYNIDILQANGSITLKYAVATKLFHSKPYIIYRNISLISYWMGKNILKKIFYKLLFQKVSFIASVGLTSSKDFISFLKIHPSRITIIRRGIPFNQINKIKARTDVISDFSLNKNTKVLVWAGALSKEKNPLFVLDVFIRLNLLRSDTVLILAGSGPEKEKLLQKIYENQLMNIHIVGFRNDLSTILAAADLLLVTSMIEGIPGVVLEAAIQKTPTLSINYEGISDVINDGINGFLVEGYNSQLFSEKLNLIIDKKELLECAGNTAHSLVMEDYDVDRNSQQFETLYKHVLQKQ
jgi:glycosyltransferase involved in cell wall biosynthesis